MRFVDDDFSGSESESEEVTQRTNRNQFFNSFACGHVFVSSMLDAMLSSVSTRY